MRHLAPGAIGFRKDLDAARMFGCDLRQDGRGFIGRGMVENYGFIAPLERDAEAQADNPGFVAGGHQGN